VAAADPDVKPADPSRVTPTKPARATPAAPAPPGDFDVELVPAPPPPRKLGPNRPLTDLRLSQRDLVMFGLGVGGSLLAILFAMLLASLLAHKTPAPQTPPESEPAKTAPAEG
jgi:hypothetical protein